MCEWVAPKCVQPVPRISPSTIQIYGSRLKRCKFFHHFTQWFNDSDADVLSSCRLAVDKAVSLGAELVEVAVPELELMRVAHTVTIVSEMHHCMQVRGC